MESTGLVQIVESFREANHDYKNVFEVPQKHFVRRSAEHGARHLPVTGDLAVLNGVRATTIWTLFHICAKF
jgi:hypothetical protein